MSFTTYSLSWALQLLAGFMRQNQRRIATLELTRFCNRRCSYCEVPNLYASQSELAISEVLQVVDWLQTSGYQVLTCLGGEPLATGLTKEDIAFSEYTTRIVEHATKLGMFVNVTSNGDYVTPMLLSNLATAGLKSVAFSLHTYTRQSLQRLIKLSLEAACLRIIPTISLTLTSETARKIPAIAAHIAAQGILVSVNICQDHGSEFSTARHDLVPNKEQQKYALGALLDLKLSGLVRTNRRYLSKAINYYRNNWRCNHSTDQFIHIGAGGTINVCSERRTKISALSQPDLLGIEWRMTKRNLVESCHNCLHQCYFEAENPDLIGDVPTMLCGMSILSGHHHWVRRWADFSIPLIRQGRLDIDWQLDLEASRNIKPDMNKPNVTLFE